MNKKLVILLSIFLFFITIDSQQNTIAVNHPDEYYVIKTIHTETLLRQGAGEQYTVKAAIPENQKIIVTGETLSSKNEPWLQVHDNGVFGWIKKAEIKSIEIKNQFLVSSTAATEIRSGDQTEDKPIGLIQKGQVIKSIDVSEGVNGERWVQVTDGRTTGWTSLDNMELFNGEKNYVNKQLFIKNDTQLKRGASFSEKSVYLLKKGTLVTVQSFYNASGETWYRIVNGEKSGWVPAADTVNQLDFSACFYSVQNSPVLRGAGSSYQAVSALYMGQKIQTLSKFVSSENQIWYKALLGNGKSGWIPGTSLSDKKIKIVYLTIDDGPTNYTSRLLDTLDNYHAKATFFMLNGGMNAHPDDLKRMINEGHAVGSHGVTHDKRKFYSSPSSAVNEMMTARGTIGKVTGTMSNLMRVPYGSVPYMKQSYREAANKQHFIMWDWNIDSLDWKFKNSKYVGYTLSQVQKLDENGPAPVILIHDRKTTLDSLPLLLSSLEKQGYTFAPLTENMQPYQFHTN